jgi:hypothetical protein
MYSLGEVNFIQGMLDFGNPKNSVVQQGRNGRIQWMGEAKIGIKPMVEIECRGEPCVRPRTKTSIEPMFEKIQV